MGFMILLWEAFNTEFSWKQKKEKKRKIESL